MHDLILILILAALSGYALYACIRKGGCADCGKCCTSRSCGKTSSPTSCRGQHSRRHACHCKPGHTCGCDQGTPCDCGQGTPNSRHEESPSTSPSHRS